MTQPLSPQPSSVVRDASMRASVLEPGARIGGHTLLSPLGSGGMGRVYLAEDEALSRRVALKVLPPEDADDEGRARFLREAHALARVQHRNVVQVFASGVDGALAWMALEYVEGEALGAVVGSEPLDEETGLSLCAQAARGLAAVHAVGVVHRDVKPDNMILDDTGVLRVVDFGVALVVGGGRGGFVTQKGVAVGTPHYMAPEQARGGAVDARADAWGLGATLFTLLTGRPPFFRDVDEPDLDILARVLRERAPDVRTRVAAVSAATAEVVARLLEPDPERRLADMGEIAATLDALADAAAAAPADAPADADAAAAAEDDGDDEQDRGTSPGSPEPARPDERQRGPAPSLSAEGAVAQRSPPAEPRSPPRQDAPGKISLVVGALSFAGLGAVLAWMVARADAPVPSTPASAAVSPPVVPPAVAPAAAPAVAPAVVALPVAAPAAAASTVLKPLPIDVLPPPPPPPTAAELEAQVTANPDDMATWRALASRDEPDAREAMVRLAAVPGPVGDAAVSVLDDTLARAHLGALRAAALGPSVPRARRAIDLLVQTRPYEALDILDEVERVQRDAGLRSRALEARRVLFRVEP